MHTQMIREKIEHFLFSLIAPRCFVHWKWCWQAQLVSVRSLGLCPSHTTQWAVANTKQCIIKTNIRTQLCFNGQNNGNKSNKFIDLKWSERKKENKWNEKKRKQSRKEKSKHTRPIQRRTKAEATKNQHTHTQPHNLNGLLILHFIWFYSNSNLDSRFRSCFLFISIRLRFSFRFNFNIALHLVALVGSVQFSAHTFKHSVLHRNAIYQTYQITIINCHCKLHGKCTEKILNLITIIFIQAHFICSKDNDKIDEKASHKNKMKKKNHKRCTELRREANNVACNKC